MIGRTLIAASLALTALPMLAAGQPDTATTTVRAAAAPPGVRIWTSHSDTYRRGELVRVYFRTERDAYVTILRVDTDGRVRILFPHEPTDPNLAHGGETYTVEGADDRDAFIVDDYPGVGYVFAVASQDPFVYDAFTGNDHWSLSAVSNLVDGRIHGDPYSTLEELVQHIVPEGYADYDTHLLPYYVEQHYQYPRFLCYDCHAFTPWVAWDPYSHFCSRFSLFVYYDPYYFYPSYWYPTRYYGGTNVVYQRPHLSGSQYVFKAASDQSAPSVVFRDRRGVGVGSAPADRGVRGADLGGVGSVPAPGSGRRMVEGGAVRAPGGVPAQRQPAVLPGAQQPGRRYAQPPTALPTTPVGGPAAKSLTVYNGTGRRWISEVPARPGAAGTQQLRPAREITPQTPRPRDVYIDPGMRAEPRATQPGPRTAPPAAAGRPEPQYIPQAPQEQRATARGYSPGAAPRAQPRSEPRSEPRATARPESRPAPRGGSPSLVRRRR